MFGLSKIKFFGLLAIVLIVAASASAFASSNVMPTISAGQGVQAEVSGYTISDVVFTHNADPLTLDTVAFGVAALAGGPDATNVKALLKTGGTWYSCVDTVTPGTFVCETTGLKVVDVNTLNIVASGSANDPG